MTRGGIVAKRRRVDSANRRHVVTHSARDRRPFIAWPLAAAIAFAIVVRAATLAFGYAQLAADPDGYRALAANVATHGVYGQGDRPTAYRPPLYPLALAPWTALDDLDSLPIAAMHLLLGVATVYLTYQLAIAAGLNRWSLLAATLVAIDPILLRQSTLVMTETLAAWLSVAALALLTATDRRPSPALAAMTGAVLGLAVLCRPTFLAWLALIPVVWWLVPSLRGRMANRQPSKAGPSRRVEALVMLLAACACVVAPWALRNWRQFGVPIIGTTHAGYTLWLGNNDRFYDYLNGDDRRLPWSATEFDAHVSDARVENATKLGDRDPRHAELADDAREAALAWETIGRREADFARAALYRLGRLWGFTPWPLGDESATLTFARRAIGVFYAVELALVALGIVAIGARNVDAPWCWGLSLVVSLTLVHSLYWTDLRMRAVAVPMLALWAAAGASQPWAFVPRRKRLVPNNLRMLKQP